MKYKGFTLVELSIVLVIIGLLIGGILVGQGLIQSAKIQSFVTSIGKFDTAVGAFKDKYGDLPGDSPRFSTYGDGNGILNGNIGTDFGFSNESDQFWPQLSSAGLESESGEKYGTGGIAGVDMPKSGLGSENSGVLVLGETAMVSMGTTSPTNIYIITDCTGGAYLDCAGGATGRQGLAVDSKLDDGDGTKGNITNADAPSSAWDRDDFVDDVPEAYDHTNDSDTASRLYIRMGASIGDFH